MRRRHLYYVYMLLCSDDSYYTGVTNDIEQRLEEHERGIHPNAYTCSRRPVVLKYAERFDDIVKAIAREKQLKGWSRKKKEALMQESIPQLKELSKKCWKKSPASESDSQPEGSPSPV